MRALLLALGALVVAAPAAAQTFTGTTTLTDPTFNRTLSGTPPTGLSTSGVGVHYNVLPFSVTASGSYSFLLTGVTPTNWDTFLALYSGSFVPTSALTNVVAANDDLNGIGTSGFTVSLTTGTSYFGVITGFGPNHVGAWSLAITGPGTAVPAGAGAVPEPASWALMILGFGAMGATMRRRSTKVSYAL